MADEEEEADRAQRHLALLSLIGIHLLIASHRYGREFADPYTLGHGVGPVPGGYGVREAKKRKKMKRRLTMNEDALKGTKLPALRVLLLTGRLKKKKTEWRRKGFPSNSRLLGCRPLI